MKTAFIGMALLLAGCVETPPPQPSAAQRKLQTACDQGDNNACKVILDKEERENAARNARVQNALSGIGQQGNPFEVYTRVASQPQPQVVLTPLTASPVMMTCWPYGQVPAPGPCPK